MKNVNKDILSLWNTGLYTWEGVACTINAKHGRTLTANACRKRHQRLMESGIVPGREPIMERRAETLPFTDDPVPTTNTCWKPRDSVPFEADNVLVVADLHAPFIKEGYLDFCQEVNYQYDCDARVLIGDVVDYHAVSRWPTDPDGFSAGAELVAAREQLKAWVAAFPEAKICVGNHDWRPYRLGFEAGFPFDMMRSLNETLHTPETWEWHRSWVNDGVLYEHGKKGGVHAVYNRVVKHDTSVVMGHTHIFPGVVWVNPRKWGMNVGCGYDSAEYAFRYGDKLVGEEVLGCGVVLDRGRMPIFVPFHG